jgi:hypothetical protein
VNKLNIVTSGCSNWSGHTATITRTAGSSTANVSLSNSYVNGDRVYIGNTGRSDLDETSGVTISGVNGAGFSYSSGGNTGIVVPVNANVINVSESWMVPYELPYKTAYQAALTALFLHFNQNYAPGGTNLSNQLGYLRFGQSVGAEAFPECSGDLGSLGNGYNYTADTGMSGVSVGWTGDYYTGMLAWAEAQHPFMNILTSLNQVTGPTDGYGSREAAAAAAATNGGGFGDGFGSQGLSLLDQINTCSQAASGWCTAFGLWYPSWMPLELQQISLSDPLDYDCMHGPTGQCGIPNNDSGDLRLWLDFAVQNHLTVLELYYHDAALAFDPQYCALDSQTSPMTCTSASYTLDEFLTRPLQFSFFQAISGTTGSGAGIASGCQSQVGVTGAQSGANGDCSYGIAIMNAHGLHAK